MPTADPVRESIRIRAAPAAVFRHFTDPVALARWLGEPAEVDARPGGAFVVVIRGETIRGQYVEVDPPRRLRVTWGRDGSTVLPPGSSQLDVTFEAVGEETLVTLVHRGLPAAEAPRHGTGWRHFLARLAERAPDPRRSPAP